MNFCTYTCLKNDVCAGDTIYGIMKKMFVHSRYSGAQHNLALIMNALVLQNRRGLYVWI